MAWEKGSDRRKPPLTLAVLDNGRGSVPGNPAVRQFLHVDMDAFFVSVEERDNPSLAGRPAAVGGGPGDRGVVTSANYIARKFGVKAGMPAGRARRLCPEIILLPVRGSKYIYVSAQIMSALELFSPDVRPLSVDEASLEITGTARLFGGAEAVGGAVKSEIRRRFGLPSTVGIAPNRLVAKVAAGLAKPDGLMVVSHGDAARVLAPLPVTEMTGIGPATAAVLDRLGIRTLGRLAEAPESLLKSQFGVFGPTLKAMARGEYTGRMRQDEERGPVEKSIGHQRTFARNIADYGELRARLVGLAEMVARRARRASVRGRVLTLTIRYDDFETISHQSVLPEPSRDEEALIMVAWRLMDEALTPSRPVRLLGLSLGRLEEEEGGQEWLFGARRWRRNELLYGALDRLRDRYGEHVVGRAMGGRWKTRWEDPIPPGGRSSPSSTE